MNLDSGDIVHTMGAVGAGGGAGMHILDGAGMDTEGGAIMVMVEVILFMVTIGNTIRKCKISRQETTFTYLKKESEI
jgi:hypothetical protein